MLLCYQLSTAQHFLSICASNAAGSAIDVWHYHYYYHYEYYALCSSNLYYVIPDLIMPNCSCIRLSTVQPQHQTYRHSSNNQTLATFTFNILTFISTCYISKHHYSLSFLNRQWVHLPSKRSKTPCHGKRCGNSSIMEAKHTFDSTTHWRWQGTGRDRMIKRKWYWQLLLHIETVECRTQCSLVRGQWRGPAWSWWWAVTRTGSCHSSSIIFNF